MDKYYVIERAPAGKVIVLETPDEVVSFFEGIDGSEHFVIKESYRRVVVAVKGDAEAFRKVLEKA